MSIIFISGLGVILLNHELRKKVLEEVDKLKDEVLDCLARLVKVKSVNPPGDYEEISRVLVNIFNELGFDDVKTLPVPQELVKARGLETPRINVLGTMKGTVGTPNLALNPHLDVVPVGDISKWTVDPWGCEIKEDKGIDWIYGRGVNDCKGDLVQYMYALVALRNAGVKLKGNATVVGSVDEETGGHLGAKWLLDEGHVKADFAIIEGYTHDLWNAANGVLWMKLTTKGKSHHAAWPEHGIDALRGMHRVLGELYAYQYRITKRRSRAEGIFAPTMVPSIIHGGVKENVVPDTCELRFDRRIIPEENPEDVRQEIIAILKGLTTADKELTIEWEELLYAENSGPTPPDSKLIQTMVRAGKEAIGRYLPVIGVRGFTDARFYWLRGIPIVHFGLGPKDPADGRAHGPDERAPLSDLTDGTKILGLAIMDLLGYE